VLARVASGFQPTSTAPTRRHTTSSRPHLPFLLPLSASDANEASLDSLTTNQIKMLRKEMNKREASNQLSQVFLSADESFGPFSLETVQSIVAELTEQELVEVRGISRDRKRAVKTTSERLALELGMESGKNVSIVQIKGHAATLYRPSEDASNAIQLRTTGKGNHWEKKAKAPRNDRGHIIVD
jgi:RNA-binding protein YhbY